MIAPFRHFGLKALSVALAVLLWMVVSGEETVERGFRIPMELQQFPAGLELRGEAPSLVDVRVRGSSGTLSRVGPGDIVAVLDLHTAMSGQRLFQLTPEQVRVPFGVQVVQVSPGTIALEFEKSATRQVPVSPQVDGEPAQGFVAASVVTDPAAVDVIGPESSIQGVTEALTSAVSIAGARQTVSESVTVGFRDPALRLKSPQLVRVTVEIQPARVSRPRGNAR